MGILIEVVVFLFGIAVICAVIWWVVIGVHQRQQTDVELHELAVSRNHQDLFLLVNDLLAIHERGYQVVFPDPETLERARALSRTYREETAG